MSLDLIVGCFAGFMTGLVLSRLVLWFFPGRDKDKPLSSAELQSLRVRHIQSRHWH